MSPSKSGKKIFEKERGRKVISPWFQNLTYGYNNHDCGIARVIDTDQWYRIENPEIARWFLAEVQMQSNEERESFQQKLFGIF